MSRRLLALSTATAAVGLTAALLPAVAASAANGVTMSVAPTHGVPGASINATIDVSGCSPEVVTVTGSYVDVNGEAATTTPVTATKGSGTSWTAALTVPADAARTSLSEEQVTFTATPDASCDPAATQSMQSQRSLAAAPAAVPTGTAKVTVDDLPAATLTVDPSTVQRGKTFDYTIAGCTGGVADFYLEDNDGTDTDIPDSTVTSQPSSTGYKGKMTVPANDAAGPAGVFLECAQAGSAEADLEITAPASSGGGSGSGVPVAVPATPRFTG
ncbi:MAG: hypothetical protein QOD70_3288 [Frankiales bacterium]|nr:hypothetical protein [Frankiales bacterium]